jgi:putative cell wall-binding protein
VVYELRNPRGVTADGTTVYVAEAGNGGDECWSPAPDSDYQICVGKTGRVTAYDTLTDTSDAAIEGLPSIDGADGNEPEQAADNGVATTGAHAVAVEEDGDLLIVLGLGATAEDRGALGGELSDEDYFLFGTLQRLPAGTDTVADLVLAGDLAEAEAENNYDGGTLEDGETPDPDSNPYDVALDGADAYVVDAGGNSLLLVDVDTREIQPVATFGPRMALAPGFLGAPAGTMFPAQAVPTSVFVHDDGLLVGELTGFPFQQGNARVWSVTGEDAPTMAHDGFSSVIDVSVGPDGNLYVLQITAGSLLAAEMGGSFAGALVRVLADGTRELLLTGDELTAPGGMDWVGDDLYVSNCSICPGAPVEFPVGSGELLKLEGVLDATPLVTLPPVATQTTSEDATIAFEVLPEGSTLDLNVLGADHGAASEGSIVYTPPAHFTGTDRIRYEACTAEGACLTSVVEVEVTETLTDRIAGATRLETAVEVSRALFPHGADTVVLARADLYPDALAGSVLARLLDAPILLSNSDFLSPVTKAELERLGASTVHLLGRTQALNADVEEAVTAIPAVETVERVGGADRFETAAAIMAAVEEVTGEAPDHVYIAEGAHPNVNRGFPDVLAVSSLAAFQSRPILLVTATALPAATADALDAAIDATILGGEVAVSAEVYAAVDAAAGTVDRINGANRYETSASVAAAAITAGMDPKLLWLATGENWPDALVAGPAVARDGGVLMLVHPLSLDASPSTAAFLDEQEPFDDVDLLGGTRAISTDTENQIRAKLQ